MVLGGASSSPAMLASAFMVAAAVRGDWKDIADRDGTPPGSHAAWHTASAENQVNLEPMACSSSQVAERAACPRCAWHGGRGGGKQASLLLAVACGATTTTQCGDLHWRRLETWRDPAELSAAPPGL